MSTGMQFRSEIRMLFGRALEAGATRINMFECEWDVSGNCCDKRRRSFSAKPQREEVYRSMTGDPRDVKSTDVVWTDPDWCVYKRYRVQWGLPDVGPYCVVMVTRCRMCDKCRKHRSQDWERRATIEHGLASRSWLTTYTLTPQEHYRVECEACARFPEFMTEPLDRQFQLRHRVINPEFTRMFKRLRKAGHRLRYVLVVEPHTGARSEEGALSPNLGMPHYHAIIHEIGAPITKRNLQAEWTLGHSGAKLLPREHVWYVTKYLSKTLASRVRASKRYGLPMSVEDLSERLSAMRDTPQGDGWEERSDDHSVLPMGVLGDAP